jgi:hypothetical protein
VFPETELLVCHMVQMMPKRWNISPFFIHEIKLPLVELPSALMALHLFKKSALRLKIS